MNPIYATTIMLLFTLNSFLGFSQETTSIKKEIFATQPNSVSIHQELFSELMNAKAGNIISVTFSEDFIFKGIVLSNQAVNNTQQTLLIKSVEFGNAIFQLSKIVLTDKSESYVGRIISTDAEDGYMISKNIANNYQLNKIELKNILQDCSY